ncbi:MAG TPA: S1C family serine protease [Acidimicrobiales bacterium]|nr:S1C family serine protease [Acidimicrobiales bacterium]
MAILDELQQAVTDVSGKVGPAVVRIGRGPGCGAGVVIAADTVATNAHNLRGEEVAVGFSDGRTETGRLAGVDVDGDLAVVTVPTAAITPVEWGEAVVTGSPVFALTLSRDGGVRVSFGLVSNVGQSFRGPRGRRIAGSFEHTAPMRRGSSGGPVVDGSGRVVGINTNRMGDGFYLALPADDSLRGRLAALAKGESPAHVHLGVALAPAGAARHLRRAVGLSERDGLLVRGVQEDSPASRAGLREGDLIVGAGERDVTRMEDLHTVLDGVASGGSITLQVLRATDETEVVVELPAGTQDEPDPD